MSYVSIKYVIMLAVLITLSTLVTITFVYPAYAVQLDAVITKDSEEFVPTFQFTRVMTIKYAEDSKLAELVGDVQQKILFNIDSQNAGILVDLINSELEQKSFVKVTDLSGEYSAIITPNEKSVGIEYKITLHLTMNGHFIGDFSTLDSQWRGFTISDEILIETEFGAYDMNSPKSALLVTIPEALEYISESNAMNILEFPLVDTSGLSKLPLSKWESMFDPTSEMSEPEQYGFHGTVITNYSMGICTIYLGLCQDKNFQEEFVIDGEKYLIYSIESQDDATIIIEGYVNEGYLGKVEIFTIHDNAPPPDDKTGKEIPMMYVMAGIGVVGIVGFFVWSDRKVRKTTTEQTGIDPKDLRAVSIGSHAGSYQTNRGTSHLVEK